MAGDKIIILEGKAIQAFALIQVKHKLGLEVKHPNGPKWRDSPAQQARAILIKAGRPDPGRIKKKVLAAYEAYLSELGL